MEGDAQQVAAHARDAWVANKGRWRVLARKGRQDLGLPPESSACAARVLSQRRIRGADVDAKLAEHAALLEDVASVALKRTTLRCIVQLVPALKVVVTHALHHASKSHDQWLVTSG